MFCQYCGTESTQGLNYCKRCGASLSLPATQSGALEARPAIQSGTAWAVGVTMLLLVTIGLGIMAGMVSELSHSGMPSGTVFWIAAAGAVTILGSIFMLTRFWMHLLGATRPADEAPRLAARPSLTNELGSSRVGALTDAPASSVTEHTTRTLEHAKKKY